MAPTASRFLRARTLLPQLSLHSPPRDCLPRHRHWFGYRFNHYITLYLILPRWSRARFNATNTNTTSLSYKLCLAWHWHWLSQPVARYGICCVTLRRRSRGFSTLQPLSPSPPPYGCAPRHRHQLSQTFHCYCTSYLTRRRRLRASFPVTSACSTSTTTTYLRNSRLPTLSLTSVCLPRPPLLHAVSHTSYLVIFLVSCYYYQQNHRYHLDHHLMIACHGINIGFVI